MSARDVPIEALDLLGRCMAHNAEQAGLTYNALLAIERRRAVALAEALIDLVKGVAAIPIMQRSVYLDDLLTDAHYGVGLAHVVLNAPDPT